jgi:hypothetical protein
MMLSAACLLISAAFFAVHAASTSYRVIYFLDSDGVGVSASSGGSDAERQRAEYRIAS